MDTDTESVRSDGSDTSDSLQDPQRLITDWLICSPAAAVDPRCKASSSDDQQERDSSMCPDSSSAKCHYWMTLRDAAAGSVETDPDRFQEILEGQRSIIDFLINRQSCPVHQSDVNTNHNNALAIPSDPSPISIGGALEKLPLVVVPKCTAFRFFDLPPELRVLVYGFMEQQWEPQDSEGHARGGEEQYWRIRYRSPSALLVSKMFGNEYSHCRGHSYPLLVVDVHDLWHRQVNPFHSLKGLLSGVRHLELRFFVEKLAYRIDLHYEVKGALRSRAWSDLMSARRLLDFHLRPCMPHLLTIGVKIAFACKSDNAAPHSLPHDFSNMYDSITGLIRALPCQPERLDLYEWHLQPTHDFDWVLDAIPDRISARSYTVNNDATAGTTQHQGHNEPQGTLSAYQYPDFDDPKATALRSTWDKRRGWRSCRKELEHESIDDIPFYREYVYGKDTYHGEYLGPGHFLLGRGKHIHPNDYKGCTARGLQLLVRAARLKDPYPQGLTLKWFYWQVVLREGSEVHLF